MSNCLSFPALCVASLFFYSLPDSLSLSLSFFFISLPHLAFAPNCFQDVTVSAIATDPTSLLISWLAPVFTLNTVMQYKVLYRSLPGQNNSLPATRSMSAWSDNQTLSVSGLQLFADVFFLQPFTLYEVVVEAITQDGEAYRSDASQGATAQAPPSGPPLALTAMVRQSRNIVWTGETFNEHVKKFPV